MVKKLSEYKFLFVTTAAAVGILLISFGFMAGYYKAAEQISYAGEAGVYVDDEAIDADFNLFWEAWQKLRLNHVKAPEKTDQDFLYGAIDGLTKIFDDPNTNFFPPAETTKFIEDVSGSFAGIGAEIANKNDKLVVVSPLKDSPAQRAGLLPGDFIIKINGDDSEEMDVNRAVTLIRGEINTTVVLTINREGLEKPKDISIVREEIVLPTTDHEYLENDTILHLSLYSFNDKAPAQFQEILSKVFLRGTRGIVLDLRNNPGGYLEVANTLAGWFLPRGELVVTERFRSGAEVHFRAHGNGALRSMPMVILINGGSASASEILAGALRDWRKVPLIGTQSYGKGTVQELLELSDGSSLKVTIANWVMPLGDILDKDGIEPDYVVEVTEEDIESEYDAQLEKAIEVLSELIAAQ